LALGVSFANLGGTHRAIIKALKLRGRKKKEAGIVGNITILQMGQSGGKRPRHLKKKDSFSRKGKPNSAPIGSRTGGQRGKPGGRYAVNINPGERVRTEKGGIPSQCFVKKK